jgi:hypothetical protein
MQNYCKTIGALAAASALVAGNAMAEVEYELHTGYSSDYLYRGVILGDDLIEAGADVKAEFNGIGLSAGAWYGTATNDSLVGIPLGIDMNMTELDLYAEVSKDFGFLKTSIGYIYRHYDLDILGTTDTGEIYFGLSHDFGFVEASLTYYWGVNEAKVFGFTPGVTEGYTELALRRSIELTPCLALNLGTNVGYLVEGGDFTAWTTKVALDWGFAEHAKLSPFAAVSIAMGESHNTIWETTDNEFVAGSMLSVTF